MLSSLLFPRVPLSYLLGYMARRCREGGGGRGEKKKDKGEKKKDKGEKKKDKTANGSERGAAAITPGNQKSTEEILADLAASQEALARDPSDQMALFGIFINQYLNSWGARGDNTPESARYLGYLDFKELYPDVGGRTLRDLYGDILAGKPSGYQMF